MTLVVLAVDWFLLGLHVLALGVSRRFSWRLGEFLKRSCSQLHEAILSRVQRKWMEVISREARQCVFAASRWHILFPCPPECDEWYLARARLIQEDLVHTFHCVEKHGEEVRGKPRTRIWLGSKKGLLFHALDDVRVLLEASKRYGIGHYLEAACLVVEKWIDECLFAEADEDVWSDHATALRTLVLLELLEDLSSNGRANDLYYAELVAALTRHAERLAYRWFYRPRHNHGIVQAYALFAAGLCLQGHKRGARWQKIGKHRLERQLEHDVSVEGVHREHSPHYHFFVLRHFLFAWRMMEESGGAAKGFGKHFMGRIDDMFGAAAFLVKPNRELPCLGDTDRSSNQLIRDFELGGFDGPGLRNYLYVITDGMKGEQVSVSGRVFADAGIMVFRLGWKAKDARLHGEYFICRTGTFNTSHIHRDVGSFEWCAFGDDLIVDSGGPYRYGSNARNYFLSTRAHNCVTVDDMDQAIGRATIVEQRIDKNSLFVRMSFGNYPMVRHERIFARVGPGILCVFDRIRSLDVHTYHQLFHLAPSLQARMIGGRVETSSPSSGVSLTMVPLIGQAFSGKTSGNETKECAGEVCVAEGKVISATKVAYCHSGRDVNFGVLLVARKGGEHISDATVIGDPFAGGCSVRVNFCTFSETIEIR